MTPSSRIPFGGRPAWQLTPVQRRARELWMLAEADRITEAQKNAPPYIPGDPTTYNPMNVAHVVARANEMIGALRDPPARGKINRNDVPKPAPTPESAERMRVLSVAAQLTQALAARDRGNDLR